MTEVRKSSKQTVARQRAREKAAQFRETQDKLEHLAADYFVATDSIEDIETAIEKEIAAARERGKKQSDEATSKAAAVIAAMLDLGTPRSEIAGRLGIATRDVRKTTPAAVSSEPTAPTDESVNESSPTIA